VIRAEDPRVGHVAFATEIVQRGLQSGASRGAGLGGKPGREPTRDALGPCLVCADSFLRVFHPIDPRGSGHRGRNQERTKQRELRGQAALQERRPDGAPLFWAVVVHALLPAAARRQGLGRKKNPIAGMRSLRSVRGAVASDMKFSKTGDAASEGATGMAA
jgi:hypothetical protein